MTRLMQAVQSFVRRDEGQDLLEYALLATFIALVAIGAVTTAGGSINGMFGAIAAGMP